MNQKVLLIVLSHAEAKDQVFRNFPHWQVGWDILGCCPSNSSHSWPIGTKYAEDIGTTGGYSSHEWIKRWVQTWWAFVAWPKLGEYTHACQIEPDAIFLRQPPEFKPGLSTRRSGGEIPGYKAKTFYHTPHIADRATAEIIVEEGRKLIEEGEYEHGSSDFFLGLILERRPEIVLNETNTFSVNGNDYTNRKADALKAIKDEKVWYVHGLRTDEELRWTLEARDEADACPHPLGSRVQKDLTWRCDQCGKEFSGDALEEVSA